jgi:hypothetical protein
VLFAPALFWCSAPGERGPSQPEGGPGRLQGGVEYTSGFWFFRSAWCL